MKFISWNIELYRSSDLDGCGIVSDLQWDYINSGIGTLYLGEVAGKHSDVSVDLCDCNIEILSEDKDFLQKMCDILPCTKFGFDLLYYIIGDIAEERVVDELYSYKEYSIEEVLENFHEYWHPIIKNYFPEIKKGV